MPLPDFSHPEIVAVLSAFLLIVGLGLTLGGWPERCVAFVIIAMTATQSLLYGTFGRPEFEWVDWIALTSDLVGFAGLYLIALNADRLWTMFAAMFQLISVGAHFSRAVTDILGISYSQMKSIPTIGVVVLLAIGTGVHLWHLRRYGEHRDWTPFAQLRQIRKIVFTDG